jgi:hypothetical protein
MSKYPYENREPEARRVTRDAIERRALQIAHSEGRTSITALDRIRAERELSPPEPPA